MDLPSAVVRQFKVKTQSLLSVSGSACRNTLQVYKDEDILGAKGLFVEVTEGINDTMIPISSIITRAVLVQVEGKFFAIKQPNNYEHR